MKGICCILLCLAISQSFCAEEEPVHKPTDRILEDTKNNVAPKKTVEQIKRELELNEARRKALMDSMQVAKKEERIQAEYRQIQDETARRLQSTNSFLKQAAQGTHPHQAGHIKHLKELKEIDLQIIAEKDHTQLNALHALLNKRDQLVEYWQRVGKFNALWQQRLTALSERVNGDAKLTQDVEKLEVKLKLINEMNESVIKQQRKANELQQSLRTDIEMIEKLSKSKQK